MRTRNCMDCRYLKDIGLTVKCAKGHKPRFYPPRDIQEAHGGGWGWKRKCEDFTKSRSSEPLTTGAGYC